LKAFADGRDWFFSRRFGLFVHWGLYAIPAWHEQHHYRLRLPRSEYTKLMHQFNPARFDPDAWLDLAEQVGMRYLCFTTKHCDGFCMWDTAYTDFSVMHTPYGRDVLAMLAEACHRRDFPLCLYYSIADMHQPNYPNAGRSYELEGSDPGDEPDLGKYIDFVKAQVRELCTNYGEIHGFWWDANVIEHRDPSINAMIRALQPNAIINNRGFDDGAFSTPERDWHRPGSDVLAFEQPTEACQSVGTQSWGYRADEDYYTDAHLIRSIDSILARGGNYLLNVGPRADGTFPPEGERILRAIGSWYNSVREAFEQAIPASELTPNREVLLTRRENTLYVHLCAVPASTAVILYPIAARPRRATLLNTGEDVETRVDLLPSYHEQRSECLRLRNLPVNERCGTALVVKLEFDAGALPDPPG